MPLEHVRQRQRNSTARCSFTSDFRRFANHQPRRRLAAQGHFRTVDSEHSRIAEGRGPGCADPRPWKKPQFHQPPGLRLRQIDAVQTGFLSLAEFSECGGAVPCHVPGESGLHETELQRALVSCAPSQVVKRGLQGGPNLHFSPPNGRSTRYDRHDFVALACRARRTVQVRLRAPKRLAPRPDGPLTHFASPRGEKCRLRLKPPALPRDGCPQPSTKHSTLHQSATRSWTRPVGVRSTSSPTSRVRAQTRASFDRVFSALLVSLP